ncbi:unnamed protein product [Notodromas monacha]|uniref:Dephospho-CoA kinase domain-containing protein n=1 Tax=Notodromas monacha TaxID=399045 RepID=A0A7R9GI99_9CRUS|nr:unnamed protein product [Notodromas monacha]CAG0921559.1 unnamed protein product [Notodromas monacha]
MFLVGLTGGIASGKSTVADMFRNRGVIVIDADLVARKVVRKGTDVHAAITEVFGPDVLSPDGEIDRRKLADMIFPNKRLRQTLNKLTHPAIYREMAWEAFRHFLRGTQFIILELPLLYESGASLPFLHKVIVVTCSETEQLERLMRRNDLDEEAAAMRIAAQIPLNAKAELADYIIDNDSYSIARTEHQVEEILVHLKSSKAHWLARIAAGAIVVATTVGAVKLACRVFKVVEVKNLFI